MPPLDPTYLAQLNHQGEASRILRWRLALEAFLACRGTPMPNATDAQRRNAVNLLSRFRGSGTHRLYAPTIANLEIVAAELKPLLPGAGTLSDLRAWLKGEGITAPLPSEPANHTTKKRKTTKSNQSEGTKPTVRSNKPTG